MNGMIPSIIITNASAANKSPQFIIFSQKNGRYYNHPFNEFTSRLVDFLLFSRILEKFEKI